MQCVKASCRKHFCRGCSLNKWLLELGAQVEERYNGRERHLWNPNLYAGNTAEAVYGHLSSESSCNAGRSCFNPEAQRQLLADERAQMELATAGWAARRRAAVDKDAAARAGSSEWGERYEAIRTTSAEPVLRALGVPPAPDAERGPVDAPRPEAAHDQRPKSPKPHWFGVAPVPTHDLAVAALRAGKLGPGQYYDYHSKMNDRKIHEQWAMGA